MAVAWPQGTWPPPGPEKGGHGGPLGTCWCSVSCHGPAPAHIGGFVLPAARRGAGGQGYSSSAKGIKQSKEHGGGSPLRSAAPQYRGGCRLWLSDGCRGIQTSLPPTWDYRTAFSSSLPLPTCGAGSDTPSPPLDGHPERPPARLGAQDAHVPVRSGGPSLLLAGGELADLAAGRAGLAGGVGRGARPPLGLGFGAQLSRLRPVHAHRLGQPLAAALPVLPGLLLRHLSCKGRGTVRQRRVAAPRHRLGPSGPSPAPGTRCSMEEGREPSPRPPPRTGFTPVFPSTGVVSESHRHGRPGPWEQRHPPSGAAAVHSQNPSSRLRSRGHHSSSSSLLGRKGASPRPIRPPPGARCVRSKPPSAFAAQPGLAGAGVTA